MATIQFGALTTTANTSDQVINTFTPLSTTVWASTTITGYMTTYAATEADMGPPRLQQDGSDKFKVKIQNSDMDNPAGLVVIPFGDGISFSGVEVVRWLVTPASATSMRWAASFFGQG